MNFKNLAMWGIIVILTIGLYNMFKNPQGSISQKNKIIFSEFLTEVDNGRVVKVEIQGKNIKGYIIQGRYDVICPPQSAYDLSKAWTNSEIKIIEKAGHSSSEPMIRNEILQTLERIKNEG